ncbi:MAG: nucleotidyltransferase family protein [Rhizobiales bacterium]|nr:nucleotidyltransferase family protein [Hyphomicrobiales bacterium]MBI3673418.1 nucleotidyltransferase family protein [Hyphomicrobiales bacterium]
MATRWTALILAAGRGPSDPMASAYGVANKCAIPVAGVAMLARVAGALAQSGVIDRTVISIEDRDIAAKILGDEVITIASSTSAPASVIAAIETGAASFPLLVTTGDHALLTPEMVRHFCRATENSAADFTVGLATAEVILAAWPQSIRTFFRFADVRVSGCNLFGLKNDKGRRLLARWQYLEAVRKKPWRLVAAFGVLPLLRFVTGTLTLAAATRAMSRQLGLTVDAVLMPFAEAAIDVDKPADKELAEEILAKRG